MYVFDLILYVNNNILYNTSHYIELCSYLYYVHWRGDKPATLGLEYQKKIIKMHFYCKDAYICTEWKDRTATAIFFLSDRSENIIIIVWNCKEMK